MNLAWKILIASLLLGCWIVSLSAAQLNPSEWSVYHFNNLPLTSLTADDLRPPPPPRLYLKGQPAPPANPVIPNKQVLMALLDGNPATSAVVSNYPAICLDLGRRCVLDRVWLMGTAHELQRWPDSVPQGNTPPLGLINVYVGDSITAMNFAAEYTIPYDAGDPVDTEADLRFSPVSGRYVWIELQSKVAWGTDHWPGWQLSSQPPAPTNAAWKVSEIELYGFADTNVMVKENAVVLPPSAPAPLQLAASELSYYLGELTGKPHPIISSAQTNQYGGTLYRIADLASLAPDYATMMSNISSGLLPNNVNIEINGREVVFNAWPYRCVLWSVWEFLERQGIRWVYPDPHGDSVPTGMGVNLSFLPLRYTPSATSIYANWEATQFQPWPAWCKQSLRQEFLYPWRNRWNDSWCGQGPLGGEEIPAMLKPNITLNSDYSEGFSGYPHNFNNVVPARILALHSNWWGYSSNLNARISPDVNNAPAFCMSNPELLNWVADKMVAVSQATPLASSAPLNLVHFNRALNLLPLDGTSFCVCSNCLAANGPLLLDPVPWVKLYDGAFSGVYYNMISQVANLVKQKGSTVVVGALAYADVFPPPATALPDNVQVEVCLYGAPNLPMSAPQNAGLKQALDTWSTRCSRLASYDYALLHVDYWQTNASLPVPLVAATVDRAKYVAAMGALDGGCQATPESIPYNPWNFYAYPRIRWNLAQTSDQLENEFFNGYFMEASAPMLAYYKTLENYQTSNNVSMYFQGYCYGITPGSFPLEVLAAMQTNLVAAEGLAKTWRTAARVAKMREGFNWVLASLGLNGTNLTDLSAYLPLPDTGTLAVDLQSMTASGALEWQTQTTNWTFWAQGVLDKKVSVSTAGTYQVVVTAKGKAADGLWPIMNVYFGPGSGSVSVASTNYVDYSFSFTIPATAGDLQITFNNAAAAGARNLFVNRIQITRQ